MFLFFSLFVLFLLILAPPTTDANMSSVWNEINLPRKQEKPMKFTVNDAYDAISEPEYVEIL